MIKVITITHECGSAGTEVARLVAHKLDWEMLDRSLLERIARVADLETDLERFDEQAARWCEVLRSRRVNLDEVCPLVAPRWFGEVDDESIHALSTQLIRAAADLGECVFAAPGAQCLLRNRSNVLNVLVYAPIADRVARVQGRFPECSDAEAFVRQMDSQAAKYMIEHYEDQWLGAGLYLYDLCVKTSAGLRASAAFVSAELMLLEENCTAMPEEEFSPCQLPPQR